MNVCPVLYERRVLAPVFSRVFVGGWWEINRSCFETARGGNESTERVYQPASAPSSTHDTSIDQRLYDPLGSASESATCVLHTFDTYHNKHAGARARAYICGHTSN